MSNEQMTLSEKMNRAEKIKDEILVHSNRLSTNLKLLDSVERRPLEDAIDIIKREIRTINSKLSILGAHCNKNTREKIQNFSDVGDNFILQSYKAEFFSLKPAIDYWASSIQSIELDYNSYPFTVKAGLEWRVPSLGAYIHTIYQRSGFPWSGLWRIFILIVGIVIGFYVGITYF
jgi:hypothetical protein